MTAQRRSGSTANGAPPAHRSSSAQQSRPNGRRPQRDASSAPDQARPSAPRTIDPWAPPSSGALRARLLRLLPLVLAVAGAAIVATGSVAGVALVVIGGVVGLTNEWIGAPRRLIGRIGGRPLGADEQPGLRNIVEGLCVASGQNVPEIQLLDDDAPNALTLSQRDGPAVLICTTGLLRTLKRIELEGVVAHELAHVKNGDARRARHAIAACGALALFAPATPSLVLSLGDPRREVLADFGGSAMTRYPPGLGAALAAIAHAPTYHVGALDKIAYRLTAPLWCAPLNNTAGQSGKPGVLDLELRAEALAEL